MQKLNLELDGLDGNAFSLIGHFRREAKRAKWTAEEIKKVQEDAMSGDYDHLLQVLMEV